MPPVAPSATTSIPPTRPTVPEPPDALVPQFPLIREAVRAFNVACVESEGFEADDLIATYARLAREAGAEVTIVSSDKDLMQLVGDGVGMWDPVNNRAIGAAEVEEKFGVGPEKVIDVQALAGDPTDNVPGVPGIGVKTAAQLIREFGDLETLLAGAGSIAQPKRREALIAHAENARLSKRLVTLADDVAVPEPLSALAKREPDRAALKAFLQAQAFRSLIARLDLRRSRRRRTPAKAAQAQLALDIADAGARRSGRLRARHRGGPTRPLDRPRARGRMRRRRDRDDGARPAYGGRSSACRWRLLPARRATSRSPTPMPAALASCRSSTPDRALQLLKPLLEDALGPQDRPRHQVRRPCLRRPRHRARAVRRHHAAVLRARRRPARPRHRRAGIPASRPDDDQLRGSRRHRQGAAPLRPGAARPGPRLCRRGRRGDARTARRPQAAAAGGAAGHRLRDAGAAAGAGAGGDGARTASSSIGTRCTA